MLRQSPFREINDTANAFNALVEALRALGRYVPRSLVRVAIQGAGSGPLEPMERQVSVLFTDIVGFTALAQAMTAPDVAKLLNEHLSVIGGAIDAEAGTIDKFIGDSMMAFWGAPEPCADHARRACRTAARIERLVEDANRDRRAEGKPPIRVRVGIHTGLVVVGDIGTPTRVNYTIIGDVVNAAERLEELARGVCDPIVEVCTLISEETARYLHDEDVRDDFALEPLGPHRLRGRDEPTIVFRLRALKDVTAPRRPGTG
jgi:class 3 adenylate cyclase